MKDRRINIRTGNLGFMFASKMTNFLIRWIIPVVLFLQETSAQKGTLSPTPATSTYTTGSGVSYGFSSTTEMRKRFPAGCDNLTYRELGNFIMSPTGPGNRYPTNVRCEYSIIGRRDGDITLLFLHLDIEGESNRPCIHDWLQIQCLDGQNITQTGKLCGYAVNEAITFPRCPTMKMTFFSDSSVTREGFLLRYTVNDPDVMCGKTLFTEPSGVIVGNISLKYQTDVHCTYSVLAGRGSSVSLKFVTVPYVIRGNTCKSRWLMITCYSEEETGIANANPYLNRKLCGDEEKWPTDLTLENCSVVLFDYSSDFDSTFSNEEFLRIEYTVQTTDNTSGLVPTPDCSEYNCSKNTGCGNTLFTNPKGVIVLPNSNTSYPVNCTFTISANRTSSFEVHVLKLDLESNSSIGCSNSWVMMGCLPDNQADLDPSTKTKFCRRSIGHLPRTFDFPKCRTVKIYLQSDTILRGDSFRISYSIWHSHDEICDNTSLTRPSGMIRSPNFPLVYPRDLDCTYTIESDQLSVVTLQFIQFDLEYAKSNKCWHDWLMIKCQIGDDRYNLLSFYLQPEFSRYLGRHLCAQSDVPKNLTLSQCDTVELHFISDYSVSKGGFLIEYTVKPSSCGEIYTSPAGFITSPSYPDPYPANAYCIYTISSNQTSIVSLEILSFELNDVSTGTADILLIACLSLDSDGINWDRPKRFSGRKLNSESRIFFRSCKTVKVAFASRNSSTGSGFQIAYTMKSTVSVCRNPQFNGPSGTIHLPESLLDLGGFFNCTYSITSSHQSTITLTVWFLDLKDSNSTSCPNDWFQVGCKDRKESLENIKISHRNCMTAPYRLVMVFPQCHSLQVIFHADFSHPLRAFHLTYTVVTENTTGETTSSTCPVECYPVNDVVLGKTSCSCPSSTTSTLGCGTSSDCQTQHIDLDTNTAGSTLGGQSEHSPPSFSSSPIFIILVSFSVLVVVLIVICVTIFCLQKHRRSDIGLLEEERVMESPETGTEQCQRSRGARHFPLTNLISYHTLRSGDIDERTDDTNEIGKHFSSAASYGPSEAADL